MLPGGDRAPAGGPQHRREHPHRRGLAVGAGDDQPRRGVVGRAQPPGQLDLAPDRDAGARRPRRAAARRGASPGEVTTSSRPPAAARSPASSPSRTSRTEGVEHPVARSPTRRPRRASTATTPAPSAQQRVGGREAARPRAPATHDRSSSGHGDVSRSAVASQLGRAAGRLQRPAGDPLGVEDAEPERRRTGPAMIQNRMTIVTSAQPAQLEVVLERRHLEHPSAGHLERADLHDHRQRDDDEQAAEQRPAAARCGSTIARPASAPPSASEPVSPMKIWAGDAFHHRKPKHAPTIAAADHREVERVADVVAVRRGVGRRRRCGTARTPMMTYAPKTITEAPVASPSRPSVRFTPFDDGGDHHVRPEDEQPDAAERPTAVSRTNEMCVRRRRQAAVVRELQRRAPRSDRDTRACPISFVRARSPRLRCLKILM